LNCPLLKINKESKAKSLKVYHEKYNPALALRLTISDYRKTDWLVNVPLYGEDRVRSLFAPKNHMK
jgi:hypothetical protein